ncbi:hypothetical protein MPDQ_002939 [Monascus purpureus]|uniref:Uncharacterized protein n=1 Tax=Monascus purpureus TaxID=5098 RepID=A0A507QJL2_MONPU|nr:hypothetical protein MPDQ_002939 [Monascus purpureus]
MAAPEAPLSVGKKSDSPSLLHHSLVTTDADALEFHTAASPQLQFNQRPGSISKSDSKLIVSPYDDLRHILDLTTLDTPNRLFAKALAIFKPIRDDYATASYTESFNWQDIFEFLKELSDAEQYLWSKQHFFVVVFRSILLPDADSERLHELDVHSHREATASGGLLKYWFGTKNSNRENLATCLWRGRTDARLGGTGPWHQKARAAAPVMYEKIVFKALKLVVDDGVKSWSFSDWVDEDE